MVGQTWLISLCMATGLEEGKLNSNLLNSGIKNWSCVASWSSGELVYVYIYIYIYKSQYKSQLTPKNRDTAEKFTGTQIVITKEFIPKNSTPSRGNKHVL